MILKQPSVSAVVLIASCAFFADMACAGCASSNDNPFGAVCEGLLTAASPGVDTVSPALNPHAGIGPGIFKRQAPHTALIHSI